MGPKPGKNSGYSKVTAVLTSHFRGMLIVIFWKINYKDEQQVINSWFFRWLITEIQILLIPGTEMFYILR